jgi:hypothetical protein
MDEARAQRLVADGDVDAARYLVRLWQRRGAVIERHFVYGVGGEFLGLAVVVEFEGRRARIEGWSLEGSLELFGLARAAMLVCEDARILR